MNSESHTDAGKVNVSEPVPITFEFDNLDMAGFLRAATGFGTKRFGYVATPNVDGLVRACEDPNFLASYTKADFVLLDSRVAGLLFRLAYGIRIPVLPGSDLTSILLDRVIQPEDRVVLIGASEAQAQALREQFRLQDLLHHNPPMGFIRNSAAVETCLKFVEASSPFRYCLIAIGDPQGMIIAQRLAERGRSRGLAFNIGASIDFITGEQRRAPRWMRRLALEWLHRLLSNPRRMASRYLIRGPRLLSYLGRIRIAWRPAPPAAG